VEILPDSVGMVSSTSVGECQKVKKKYLIEQHFQVPLLCYNFAPLNSTGIVIHQE